MPTSVLPSRRSLLGAAGGTAALVAVPSVAHAAVGSAWTPARYTKTTVLSPADRLLAQRFSAGVTPQLRAEIAAAGGGRRWFEAQLRPDAIDDTWYRTTSTWWRSVNASAAQVRQWNMDGTQGFWLSDFDYARWSMMRRMYSRRQLLEQMAAFWEDHFHVPCVGNPSAPFRADYGKQIRLRALGTFEDLLRTCTVHPAMGMYLSNAESTKDAPNENLGRELLELHTVGRAAYDENDVKNSARILTGYRADVWNRLAVWYDPASHWTGPVRVLGFTDANSSSDGRATTGRYLHYLAHHPATARRICTKLAVRFVRDTPSTALVDHLVAVYQANGTAIVPVLRALISSAEFRASANAKVRTPDEDVVATYRALGIAVRRPTSGDSAANAMLWLANNLGLMPYSWPRPDGRPDTADAWSSGSRILAGLEAHYTLAGGWYPTRDATFHKPASWLPQATIRFDLLVDHVARRLTGAPSTAAMLHACCQATGVSRSARITASHPLVRWNMPRLLVTILDSPAHLTH